MGMQDSMFRRVGWLYSKLGLSGRRDLYETFGYTRLPGFDHKFFKYMRQDIAARIVDAPAAALWTNPPQVSADSEEWNAAWNDLVARNDLFAHIERADKLSGIGRFAVLIIGFNDGNGLEMPVNPKKLAKRTQKVLFLQAFSERSTEIMEYETDSSNERFNKPKVYRITPDVERQLGFSKTSGTSAKTGKMGAFTVHASRVVHIAQNLLENDVFGLPILERVYNILDDLQKVTGGSAETFWLTANRGIHIDVDKEMDLEPTDEAALSAEVREYIDGLTRFIRTRGAKVNSLGSDTPDPSGVFKVLVATLSGATAIPQRILIGSEAGQLASEQDRANWADRIDERRADWANPTVLHQLLKVLFAAGYFPVSDKLAITVNWPSAFKLSPLEAAQTSAQHARSATNFAKAIETMENLKRGEPGSPGKTDAEGNPIPGSETPTIEGVDLEDLVTVDEARKFIGLDKPEVTFDSGEDLVSQSRGVYKPNRQNPVNVTYIAESGRI